MAKCTFTNTRKVKVSSDHFAEVGKKGRAGKSARLFFFFAQLFLFLPPALYEVGEASEKEKFLACMCVRVRRRD